MNKTMVWGLAFIALLGSATVMAADKTEKLELRLERMERLINSQSLLEMMERIDAMQLEIQQLRGELEEQQHQMEGMKSRQRELYLDVDRRMSRLEREGAGAAMPSTAAVTTTTTPLTTANATPPEASATTPATTTTTAPKVVVTDPQQLAQEREAYQKAFDLLRELRYEQATAEFRGFLKQYPNGRYAHIAQYWLGEAAYARRDFTQAIKDYQALLDNHPRSAKRAEAMLKIGYSYQELNKGEEAKKMMEQLIELYPDSTEAGQAKNQLRRMKKSGS